jgi:hypothetical protein
MKRALQVVRAAVAAAVVAADSVEVAGVAIVAAVAVEVVAGDAGIAGDSDRVFTTHAAGPVGVPRFFLVRPIAIAPVCDRRECVGGRIRRAALLRVGVQGASNLGCNLYLASCKSSLRTGPPLEQQTRQGC